MDRRFLALGALVVLAVAAIVVVRILSDSPFERVRVSDGDGFILDHGSGRIVVLRSGEAVLFDATTLEPVADPVGGDTRASRVVLHGDSVELVPKTHGIPILPGGRTEGAAPAPWLLAHGAPGEIVSISRDGESLPVEIAPPWSFVSLAPDSRRFVVGRAAAAQARPREEVFDLFLCDATGATIGELPGVAPAPPYWTEDSRLLYERRDGTIWIEGPTDPVYLCSLRFSRHPARGRLAAWHAAGRVLVESTNAEGFLELASIRVEGTEGRASRQLTSGRVAHFGPVIAAAGRFVIFRRVAGSPGEAEEAVVVTDREIELHSWVLARREAASISSRMGPQVIADKSLVFFVEEGAVWRVDLSGSP